MMLAMPEFMKHKECFYCDPREMRLKLTDKATQEDVDSYLQHFSLRQDYKTLVQQVIKDIEDYRVNKARYTFEDDGNMFILATIDGKEVKYLDQF